MINLRCSGVFFLLLAASAGALADSQVYIWQRVWNDQHKTALQQSQALFATLRVLGIQFHPQEGVRLARVNTSLLQQDGRPVWLVVRLDGSLTQLDTTTMLPQIKRLVTTGARQALISPPLKSIMMLPLRGSPIINAS